MDNVTQATPFLGMVGRPDANAWYSLQPHKIWRLVSIQSKVEHPRMCAFSYIRLSRCLFLWHWQITNIYELDLDILKMYQHKVSRPRLSELTARARQTDTHTDVSICYWELSPSSTT